MQAPIAWNPPEGTLGRIVAEATSRVEELRGRAAELERLANSAPAAPSLAHGLSRAEVAILAEVKRRSPSKGAINEAILAADQARLFASGGASGVSVLTEPRHFGGSPDDLVAVRDAVSLPVLKKDFHVHELQLLEARALGASAVLLIARALSPERLPTLAKNASDLGLEVLIEVRDERELERAVLTQAEMIGVNNRNLETLEIDPTTVERILPSIPPGRVAIAESGMSDRAAVERAAASGADAVLIGSALSASPDPAATLRSFTGVHRLMRSG